MHIRRYADLVVPDDRSLRFTPWGIGSTTAAETAAEDYQRSVAHVDLVEAVPETVRRSFERVRGVYCYGLFNYDLFTVANDLSLLLLEHALAERFMEFHNDSLPFVFTGGERAGEDDPLAADSFEDVYAALHWGSHKDDRLRLRLSSGGSCRFRGSLEDLFRWARAEGLLRGQRSRRLDRLLTTMRNHVAHARDYHLLTPTARWILDTAEIINQLWGAPTPGGRLFPDRLPRQAIAVAWDPNMETRTDFPATILRNPDVPRDWTYILVQAVEHDDGLLRFDARYESTNFPSEYLWGPGSWIDAVTWLETARPGPDTVDYLDRHFVVRQTGERTHPPLRPDVAAGLDADARAGTWNLICADFPVDAFTHVRGPWGTQEPCATHGYCTNCSVEVLAIGSWTQVITHAKEAQLIPALHRPADAHVPISGFYE